jgi:N-acetyl-anhydromuramyl-L-alanine amidase AmpD
MQGYQRTMDTWARQRPYRTPKSAHFTISRTGVIHQHVSAFNHSWAAGGVCRPTWALLPANTNPNRVAINIEWEGFSIDPRAYSYDYLYGEGRDAKGRAMRPWPQAQVDAAVRIHRWLFAEGLVAGEPNVNTITGHYATDACSRLYDPGPFWVQTVRPGMIDALTATTAPPVESETEPPGTSIASKYRAARLTAAEARLNALEAKAHVSHHTQGT